MSTVKCYGCKYLLSKPDDAGGGVYLCQRFSGLVVGEWGYWADSADDPWGNTECYEKGWSKGI